MLAPRGARREARGAAIGYDRFSVPDGSRLVASEAGSDGRSVLAVDDVDVAMDTLTAQVDGSPGFSVDATPATQPDGQEVTHRVLLITAGGGGCELLASADGAHLLITGHSD